jgi:hypothetical protein
MLANRCGKMGFHARKSDPDMRRLAFLPALLLATLNSAAADVDVRVIMSTDVRPGIYGRVELGNAPPPPVVYAEPVLIAPPPRPPRTVIVAPPPPPQPIYLHVPPGHAKNWKKHCKKYHACDRPVYFVMSDEYKPKKGKKEKKEH